MRSSESLLVSKPDECWFDSINHSLWMAQSPIVGIAKSDFGIVIDWVKLRAFKRSRKTHMKALAEKIKEAFGKKQPATDLQTEHPNFWMYR